MAEAQGPQFQQHLPVSRKCYQLPRFSPVLPTLAILWMLAKIVKIRVVAFLAFPSSGWIGKQSNEVASDDLLWPLELVDTSTLSLSISDDLTRLAAAQLLHAQIFTKPHAPGRVNGAVDGWPSWSTHQTRVSERDAQ